MEEISIALAINDIMSKVFYSIEENIYALLDDIAFVSQKIINNEIFEKIFSKTEGILLVGNALILGVILFYSVNYLFSHIFVSKLEPPNEFIFKLIIFTIIMNSANWICLQIINIVDIITQSIQLIGKNIFFEEITFSNFITNINEKIYTENFEIDIISFDGIIKSFTSAGFMNLIFSYSLRYIMIQAFVLISPFAFLSLINNRTEWFFKTWIKMFLSLLIEQILVILILLLSFSFDYTNTTISKLMYIGIIYALMRVNNYMYMLFGGISTNINRNLTNINKE